MQQQIFHYPIFRTSGHRRSGDLASWFHWNTDIQPICVDVAIHEKLGNARDLDNWIQLIKTRRVVGAHAGPPCETYSAARWLPSPDSIFPRPLRTSDVQTVVGSLAVPHWHNAHADSNKDSVLGIHLQRFSDTGTSSW